MHQNPILHLFCYWPKSPFHTQLRQSSTSLDYSCQTLRAFTMTAASGRHLFSLLLSGNRYTSVQLLPMMQPRLTDPSTLLLQHLRFHKTTMKTFKSVYSTSQSLDTWAFNPFVSILAILCRYSKNLCANEVMYIKYCKDPEKYSTSQIFHKFILGTCWLPRSYSLMQLIPNHLHRV